MKTYSTLFCIFGLLLLVMMGEVKGQGLPPVAEDDCVKFMFSLDGMPLDVLVNDFDPEGGELTVTIVSFPYLGVINGVSDGVVFYDTGLWVPSSGTDTFVYQVCDEEGLCDQASVAVYYGGLPEINSSFTTIESGESKTICISNGVGGFSYVWNNGSSSTCIVVSPTQTTTYTVVITTNLGCTYYDEITVIVTMPDQYICPGETATLCPSSGCATYLWSTGQTSECITVSWPGNYTLTCISSDGYATSDEVTVFEGEECLSYDLQFAVPECLEEVGGDFCVNLQIRSAVDGTSFMMGEHLINYLFDFGVIDGQTYQSVNFNPETVCSVMEPLTLTTMIYPYTEPSFGDGDDLLGAGILFTGLDLNFALLLPLLTELTCSEIGNEWVTIGQVCFEEIIDFNAPVNLRFVSAGEEQVLDIYGTVIPENQTFPLNITPAEYFALPTPTPNPPAATFTLSTTTLNDTAQVCTGQTLQFTNTSTEATSYNWYFGNGDFSTAINPSYTYETSGNYTTTLIAQNNCGDSDTATVNITVLETFSPSISCISTLCPETTEMYSTDAVCDTYIWTVTGAVNFTGQGTPTISIEWGHEAIGTITLETSGCAAQTCELPVTEIVPIVASTADITGETIVCQNEAAVYNLPVFNNTDYQWALNPASAGTIVSGQGTHQATIIWLTSGEVQAVYNNLFLECGGEATLTVQVEPIFEFSGTMAVCDGDIATFTASPSDAFNWTATGGTLISSQGADMAEFQMDTGIGEFTVTATPVTAGVYCNEFFSQTLSVVPLPESPNAINGDLLICPGETYTYAAMSSQVGSHFEWSISNGTIVFESSNTVSVVWDAIGMYSLSAVRVLSNAPNCVSAPILIEVEAVENVTISGGNQFCAESTGSFSAVPILENLSYEWSITPTTAGEISEGQNTPNVTILWNQTFSPQTATVTAELCGQSGEMPVQITPLPTPEIIAPTEFCENETFTMTTAAPYASLEWLNEAGVVLGTDAGIVLEDDGTYSVAVTDVNGCTGTASVTIHERPAPEAHIMTQDNRLMNILTPHDVTLYALKNENYQYNWLLDGTTTGGTDSAFVHVGTDVEGVFSYQVEITNGFGCVSTSSVLNVVQYESVSGGGGGGGGGGGCDTLIIIFCGEPIPPDLDPTDPCVFIEPCDTIPGGCTLAAGTTLDFASDDPVCNPVNFENTSAGDAVNFNWHFGDGTNENTIPFDPTSHLYNLPGFYEVRLIGAFTNLTPAPDICLLSTTKDIEVPLSADFDAINACPGDSVRFANLSLASPNTVLTNWTWDFGDGSLPLSGNTPEARNPAHLYPSPGTFTATLTVSDGECTASISKEVTVYDLPNIEFETSTIICPGNPADFMAVGTDGAAWSWNFGDDTYASLQNAVHVYDTVGVYEVWLTVENIYGCADSSMQTVEVMAIETDTITASATEICEGEIVILDSPMGVEHLWSNGDTTPSIAVTQSGTFWVEVTNVDGCTYITETVAITVHPLPPAEVSPSGEVGFCEGETVTLTANLGAYEYLWNNGETTAQLTSSMTLTAYQVTVTNPFTSCQNVSEPVTLFTYPVLLPPTITPNMTNIEICQGETITLTANHAEAVTYHWNTGANTTNIQVTQSGFYEVRVTDENGCMATTGRQVTVHPLPDISVFPAGCYEYCEGEAIGVPDIFGGYQWLQNGSPISGATAAEYTPTEDGDYQLILTTQFGCTDTTEALQLTLINCDCTIEVADFLACLISDETYNLSVLISNGTPPYTVTGTFTGVTDSTFTVTGIPFDTDYEIHIVDANGCTFDLVETPFCLTLPIELVSFSGKVLENGTLLEWVSSSEVNNDFFTLARSSDGILFKKIAKQTGQGNSATPSHYEFLDPTAPTGISYYHLSQTDFDGTTKHLKTIALERQGEGLQLLSIVPIPASDKVTISFIAHENHPIHISLLDVYGRVIQSSVLTNLDGNNVVNLDISALVTGLYLVRLESGGEVMVGKVVRE